MKRVLAIVAVVALIGVVGLLTDGASTGMYSRNSPQLKVMQYCPNGCYWGDPLVVHIDGKTTAASKNDFAFEKCRIPEKAKGCYPDRTELYPYAFKGTHIGMITCMDHAWSIPFASMSLPCPPELAKLD